MQRQQTGGRAKATVFLVAALAVAGTVSYLVLRALQTAEAKIQQAEAGPEKVQVLVATRDRPTRVLRKGTCLPP